MTGRPEARLYDPVVHPLPLLLQPGPGSINVVIGFPPVWRGMSMVAAGVLQSAKAVSDQALLAAKSATTATAPAAIAAEETAKTITIATLVSMITSMAGGEKTGCKPNKEYCAKPYEKVWDDSHS